MGGNKFVIRRSLSSMAVIIMLLLTISIVSTAQSVNDDNCWGDILRCLQDASIVGECCPVLNGAISDERDCFCIIKERVSGNATRTATLAQLLNICGQTDPFETLCPDSATPPTEATSPPSPDFASPPTETMSPPSSEGPALTPSDETSFPPPPGSDDSSLPPLPSVPSPTTPTLSPVETPIMAPTSSPSSDRTSCWSRIVACTNTSTTATQCCPLIKKEIANERECFCLIQQVIREDPSLETGVSSMLTTCSIPGSLDTLCPGSALSPSDETLNPTPPDSPTSPSEFIFPPGSPTSPSELLFPPPPDATTDSSSDSDDSGSNKIVISVGLLLPRALLLIICAIIMS